MSAIDTIMSRHSYRGKYKNDPIPKDDLRIIMEAGLAAPSGCNKQTTSLICVDDDRICDRIAEILKVSDDYELICILPVGIAEDSLTLPGKNNLRSVPGLTVLSRKPPASKAG